MLKAINNLYFLHLHFPEASCNFNAGLGEPTVGSPGEAPEHSVWMVDRFSSSTVGGVIHPLRPTSKHAPTQVLGSALTARNRGTHTVLRRPKGRWPTTSTRRQPATHAPEFPRRRETGEHLTRAGAGPGDVRSDTTGDAAMTMDQDASSGSTPGTATSADEAIKDEESANPRFWLAFRTFDDGMATIPRDSTLAPPFAMFPQFGLLPPELRLKIWAYLVQPRVVVACCLHRGDDDDAHAPEKLECRRRELDRRTTRGCAVPAVLHVNREARAVGLRHYELTFGWRISKMVSETPTSAPPRVYFNYAEDALLLTGELEAYGTYGINFPLVYFLNREDTFRVRHVACAFRELGYPEQESEQVWGCLWHVVDRFPGAERLLLTVGEGDEEKLGGAAEVGAMLSPNNVVQKIWSAWMSGTTVTSSRMADKQMLLVREEGLMEFVASQV